MKPVRLILSTLLIALAVTGCDDDAPVPGERVPITVVTAKGDVKLKVEVARTEEEQARGLMFRTSLPADGGMLFPLDPPRFASFWMKNTLIPLDMIFVRSDGSIARIEPETVPHSLAPVASGEVVGSVLELAGGKASALGINEGDVVRWDGLKDRAGAKR
jgi:uncharacterized protein